MSRAAQTTRRTARVVPVALLVMTLAACAGFRVERDGRKTGDAICDLKGASSASDAQSALADAQRWLDKAKTITGRPVGRDVRDVSENLSDIARHAANGNSTLAQQDVAVIRRNVQSIVRVTSGHTQRFFQGLDEGLSNCSD
jgi:Tfp pilus assembly protein PilX